LKEEEVAEIQREVTHLWKTWIDLEKMEKLPCY